MEERTATSKVKRQTGAFTFRVEGYGGLSTRVGESCESPEFDLCGHIWQLRIFPGGSLEIHRGFMSFYLASKSTRNSRASYKLTVCNQCGSADEWFASSGVRVFEAKGVQIDGWGRDKFMTVSNLMSPEKGFYINDIVIFKTEITVFSELEHEDTLENPISLALKNQTLVNCMRTLYESAPISGEIRLTFDDTQDLLHAHRCILIARSPVFRAMFNSQMKESFSQNITVHDVDISTMRELLIYMYTDSFSDETVLDNQAEDLLAAATKYDILGVIYQCEQSLIQQVDASTVFELLVFADAYAAIKLKQHCIQFLGTLKAEVLKSPQFLQLHEDLIRECINNLEKTNRLALKNGSGSNSLLDKKQAATCVQM